MILKQIKEKAKRKRVGLISKGPPARGILICFRGAQGDDRTDQTDRTKTNVITNVVLLLSYEPCKLS